MTLFPRWCKAEFTREFPKRVEIRSVSWFVYVHKKGLIFLVKIVFIVNIGQLHFLESL